MRLYLLRHAIADDRDAEKYPDDGQRPLTEAGTKKMIKIAQVLSKMDLKIDLILSSPLVRTRETAEIAREHLRLEKDCLVLVDQLAPLGDPGQLITEIQTKYLHESLLLVGHEPDLSNLISLLLSGDTTLSVTMKKGGICCLSINQLVAGKCAILEWLINPGQMLSLK
jgi:phosphohistidine phosphatase